MSFVYEQNTPSRYQSTLARDQTELTTCRTPIEGPADMRIEIPDSQIRIVDV